MRTTLRCALSALMMLTITVLFATKAVAEDQSDPYAVPEGSTQDYVDFLIKLAKVKPANKEESDKMRAALVEASEKIIAGNHDEKQLELAVSAKSQAIGPDLKKLASFAAELKEAGLEKQDRFVRGFALLNKLNIEKPTTNDVVQRIKEIVDHLGEAAIDGPMDFQLVQVAAILSDKTGDPKLAMDTAEKLKKMLEGSSDPNAEKLSQLCDLVVKKQEGALRRFDLPGKSMELEGNIIGGGEVDLSSYKGKVVLVNFFATWCGPCRKEIENVKKLYDLYHDKGFEVIGVSLDRNKESLDKFIKDKDLPWPIVYGDNGPSPTVSYYGISGIPQLILVGKDGNVITINARGKTLVDELKKQFGPAG